ncbi:MAG: hypothetical protein QOI22_1577, partial [Verrucomicrobiota bacterium]
VVFGRRGARPFHLDEMDRFYRRSTFSDAKDLDVRRRPELYRVEDVTLSGGILTTKRGVLVTPLSLPSPTPSPVLEGSARATPRVESRTAPTAKPRR